MKVLIVEDDEAIANLVKLNLSAEGYQCVCAYDGKAGADYIEAEAFDLILLDERVIIGLRLEEPSKFKGLSLI